MALFTDGVVSGMEDLTAQDSQLASVASVEGIDVTQKLALAQDDLSLELGTLLARLSLQPDIGCVVITPALKLWHTYRTLTLVYSDAYNNQLNDRYAGKRDQFHRMAKQAYNKLIEIGIGMTTSPVPRAATPSVAATVGGLPDGTYYVTMAWVNAAGEEGAAATPAVITTAASTLLIEPGAAPQTAAGWNVYAGADPNQMMIQNAAAIAPSEAWLQPPLLATGGRGPGTGQSPSYVQPVPRVIPRG